TACPLLPTWAPGIPAPRPAPCRWKWSFFVQFWRSHHRCRIYRQSEGLARYPVLVVGQLFQGAQLWAISRFALNILRNDAMLRLRIERVGPGQHPSEVVVAINTGDGGREELIVDRRSIDQESVAVGYPIGSEGDQLLVELPRETLRGNWRVWVSRESLIKEAVA